MENVYNKFFSTGQGGGDYKSYYFSPSRNLGDIGINIVQNSSLNFKKNNVDYFFSNSKTKINNDSILNSKINNNKQNLVQTPTVSRGHIIQNLDGTYKVKPPQNLITMFGNPVKPVNINQTDFNSFDNYDFMNSQNKQVADKYLSPQALQMQLLNEKIRNMEKKQEEERTKFYNLIQSNQNANSNFLPVTDENKITDLNLNELTRKQRRKMIKHKIDRYQEKLNDEFSSESNDTSNDTEYSRRHINGREKSLESINYNRRGASSNTHKSHYGSREASPNYADKKIYFNTKKRKPGLDMTDNDKVTKTLQEIKEEISAKLQEESLKNQEGFNKMAVDFKQLKSEISNKLEFLDHKQKINMENLRFILERSGNERLKYLTRKVFDGEVVNEDEYENFHNKNRRGAVDFKLPEEAPDKDYEELKDYVEENKIKNDKIKADLEGEDNSILEDFEKLKNEKKNNFKDKILSKQKMLNERLNIQAERFRNKVYELKLKNRFRSYVYSVIISHRLLNIVNSTKSTMHSQSLNMFVLNYESMNTALNNWVFSCIRVPFLSILNTQYLEIDLTSYSVNSKSITDVYIRLETRVSGFIKCLFEEESLEKLDIHLKSYLNLLITNNAFIPKEFFNIFCYSRLQTENQELKNLNDNQMKMILACYIICQILCKNILIDQNFSQNSINSTRVKNNLKMCASVIYRSTIDYFSKNCPILRKITDMATYLDTEGDDSQKNSNRKMLYDNIEKNPEGEIDPSYLEACKKFEKIHEEKQKQLIEKFNSDDILKVIEKIQKFSPDSNPNEIECIHKAVYQPKDLTSFYKMAEKNKYDLSSLLIEFLDKLIGNLNVNNA